MVMMGAGDMDGQEGVRPSSFLATSALLVQAPRAQCSPQLEQPRPPWQIPEAPPWFPAFRGPPPHRAPEGAGHRPPSGPGRYAAGARHDLQA